uniref:SFRICE_027990 n=1 Tax=Spodoptera frugiperda TaxID=7108 RepID=A0A2H1V524_SPOFR
MKFTCEITCKENPNEQQLGRKPARHDHLAWSEDPPFLRELYSLFPKGFFTFDSAGVREGRDGPMAQGDKFWGAPMPPPMGSAKN